MGIGLSPVLPVVSPPSLTAPLLCILSSRLELLKFESAGYDGGHEAQWICEVGVGGPGLQPGGHSLGGLRARLGVGRRLRQPLAAVQRRGPAARAASWEADWGDPPR